MFGKVKIELDQTTADRAPDNGEAPGSTGRMLFGKAPDSDSATSSSARMLFGKVPDTDKATSSSGRTLFGKVPDMDKATSSSGRTLFGKVPDMDKATSSSGRTLFGKAPDNVEATKSSSPVRMLFGKPVKEERNAAAADPSRDGKRGFRPERKLFGKDVPHTKIRRDPVNTATAERQTSQDTHRSPRLPLNRQFSEEMLTRKVSIVCKPIPARFNNQSALKRHFSRFGRVMKVFPNVNKMQATIHFHTHEEAVEAKRNGRILDRSIQPLSIYWGTYLLPPAPSDTPSKMAERPFSRPVPGAKEEAETEKPKKPAWGQEDDVKAELSGMAGTQDFAGGRESSPKPRAGSQDRLPRGPSPVPSTSTNVNADRVSLQHFNGMVARTTTEKVQLLNLRDKYIRQIKKKNVNVDVKSAKAFVGTCKDMCPEKERYDREDKRRLSYYEIVPGTENIPGMNPVIDHSRAVKEYIRSSPDQDEPLPHELRPLPVLQQTMTYLLKEVANQGEDGRWGDWFDFLWNRTRGIRKDITQQQLCDRYAAELIEKCARFHIYCSERLCEEDMHSFDAKINNENLTKCLQTLKEFYVDLEKKQRIFCPEEAEFRAYTVLMNLNEGDTLREVQKLRPEVRSSIPVRFALEVYFALSSNNYIKFFKLLKSASFANGCIMHRYFPQVRIKALLSMMRGYRPGARPAQIPLTELVRLLAFEGTEEAASFCSHYGFQTTEGEVILDKSRYLEPESALPPFRSKNYIESKLMVTCGEMINGDCFPPDYKLLAPHSSFDENDRFIYEGRILSSDSAKAPPRQAWPVEQDQKPTISVKEQAVTVPFAQPVDIKPPAPPVIPPEFIKDSAKVLFWEVIAEMVGELAREHMREVDGLLNQSRECADYLINSLVFEETRGMVIEEINAERSRIEAEELELRKQRISTNLLDGILYDVLYLETNNIAKQEYREVQARIKRERIERVTTEIQIEYFEDVSDSFAAEIATEVFETDVTQRLQNMERAENAVKLSRKRRFFGIWRKYYQYVLKLKRAVTEFPATGSLKGLKVQNERLTGHADNKIIDNQFLVGKAQLTVLSPLEILKKREAREYKCALLDLKRTMQSVLAWQPEDVSQVVYKILQKKIPDREKDQYPDVNMQWKMLISLPHMPEEKPKTVEGVATKLLSDWFNRKYTFGSPPQHLNYEKSKVLTLSKTKHPFVDKVIRGFLHLDVCVRSVEGCPSQQEVDVMRDEQVLLGTAGMIFVLPAPVVSMDNPDSRYWSDNRERLHNILEAGRTGQAISLVIVMALDSAHYEKHESFSSVSDNLKLEDLIEENLIFDYHFVEILFNSKLHYGIQVTDKEFYKKVCEGIEWIAERSLPPPTLKVSTLREFIENILLKLFYPPMLKNLKQRKICGYLERNPNSILQLYNCVIDHARFVLTSPVLSDMSWPVPEFVSKDNCNLPAKHWNTPEYQDYIADIVESFKLPEFILSNPESDRWVDAKFDVSTYFADHVGVKSPVILGNLSSLLKQVEVAFEQKCQEYNGEKGCQPFYVHLPCSKIIPMCFEHKFETTDFRDPNMDVNKMGCAYELRVAYNPQELLDFDPPVEWKHDEAEESFKSSPSLELTVQAAAERQASEKSRRRKTKRSYVTETPNEFIQTKRKASDLLNKIKNEQLESENFIKKLEKELARGESELSSFRNLSEIDWNQGQSSFRRKSDAGLRRKSEEYSHEDKGKRPRKRYSEIGTSDRKLLPLHSLKDEIQNLQDDIKKVQNQCEIQQERMRLDAEYNDIMLKLLTKSTTAHNETF